MGKLDESSEGPAQTAVEQLGPQRTLPLGVKLVSPVTVQSIAASVDVATVRVSFTSKWRASPPSASWNY